MSGLSPERREELAWEVTYGCGCYSGRGLCESCRIVFDRIAPLVADMLAAEREAGAAEVRARVMDALEVPSSYRLGERVLTALFPPNDGGE